MIDIHLGPIPPPIGGGISIYLKRLLKIEKESIFIDERKFINEKNINLNVIFGMVRYIIFLLIQFSRREKKNIIYHKYQREIRLILYFLSILSKSEFSLVIHGRSLIEQYKKSNIFIKTLMKKMLEKAKFIQVVNKEYKRFILDLKVKNKNIFVKNAFLPPPEDEEEEIKKKYSLKLKNFIDTRSPLIVANASSLQFYKGIDLYGLDLCINLISDLKTKYPNIGLIFGLTTYKKNNDYLIRMKNNIKKLNLAKNFLIAIGLKDFWPIIKKADLMLRPTYKDGDSISVREALYLGTPVITSDTTSRPKGCILFKNRNYEDLMKKTNSFLKKI
jgi:glycosyltransferase involved in cell wall biosynthesis